MRTISFISTVVMLLFVGIAKGQTQTLIFMQDAGSLQYKGATYQVRVENISKDEKGNILIEITSSGAEIPVSDNSDQMAASISKYIMVKMIAGGKTYNAKNTILKTVQIVMSGGIDGSVSKLAKPQSLVFSFETKEYPDRITIYNDELKSVSFVSATSRDVRNSGSSRSTSRYTQPAAPKKTEASVAKPSVENIRAENESRKWFAEIGFSVYVLVPDFRKTGFGGIMINGGYYISPENRLSLDISINFITKNIANFSYTKNGHTYTNGLIKRNYTAVPVLATWNHLFRLGDAYKLRLGPSIGLTALSVSDTYDPENVIYDPNTENATMFTLGGGTGINWQSKKRFYMDAGYKFLWNSNTVFEGWDLKTTAHMASITAGWRF